MSRINSKSKYSFVGGVCMLVGMFLSTSSIFCQDSETIEDFLKRHNCDLSYRLNQYDYAHYNKLKRSWHADKNLFIQSPEASFGVSQKIISGVNDEFYEIEVDIECLDGEIDQASLSIDLHFHNWSEKNYVLMPGVVYDGNRPFEVYKAPGWYPFITDNRYIGPDKAPYIADVPRLSNNRGVSKIQLRSGHMTTPSVGFQNPMDKKGFLLLTHQGTTLGDSGITIEENRDRTSATITLTAPVVRELYRYRFMQNDFPSDDIPVTLKKGDKIKLKFRMYFFKAPRIQSLYEKLAQERKSMDVDGTKLYHSYPFSHTFEILEKKFTKYQWNEDKGYFKFRYYKDTLRRSRMSSILTYPLLIDGSEESKKRVMRSLDWFFENALSPSGYVWHTEKGGKEFGGIHPGQPIGDSVTLVRRSSDALFYFIKHFKAIQKNGQNVKSEWEVATKKIAQALMNTWGKYGQLGQWVSLQTGDVIVGNSTNGGIAPAGLILASEYFQDKMMKEVALEMGEHFYQNYTRKGLTYGGPGDILNSPDCEAAYGLVESFTLLYEATKDLKWLTYATEAAKQFSTWVMSYNFTFPENSHFGKFDINPMGAVFASPQNGTGTPGICTYSGISLLNLTRYTGDPFYAGILLDIAHHLPQYLSHPDKMLNPEHVGWMSERVVTSDWLQDIGEISYHTTWPETSLALTFSELPGIYIPKDLKQLLVFDNVNAKISKDDSKGVNLIVENPTKYDAKVKVFLERKSVDTPLSGYGSKFQIVELKPFENKRVRIN